MLQNLSTGADYAIAASGIAGPSGATRKPVGLWGCHRKRESRATVAACIYRPERNFITITPARLLGALWRKIAMELTLKAIPKVTENLALIGSKTKFFIYSVLLNSSSIDF
jgi:nicotinamide mononucleotide (NMN) deamidase PncC